MYDAQTLVLLAGLPEVAQDRGVAAKAVLQDHVVERGLQEGADLSGGIADNFVQGRDGLIGEGGSPVEAIWRTAIMRASISLVERSSTGR